MAEVSIKELEYRLQVSDHDRMRLKKRLLGIHALQDRSSVLSMLDMMTLLLLFFIIMYVRSAVTQIHHATRETPPSAIPPEMVYVPSIPEEVPGPRTPQPVAAAQAEVPGRPVPVEEPASVDPALGQLQDEITQFMNEEGARGSALRWDQRRLVFVLGERITFQLGQANLLLDFEPALSKMAGIFSRRPDYRILVSGHTDDQPIHTPLFPSNWELSAGRAIAVAKFLSENGVDPTRIVIQGFAEYQPMAPNNSNENRQLNRRVEIRMIRHPAESGPP